MSEPHARSYVSESVREREFYRYFEPIRGLSANGPIFCDLNSEAAVNAHAPVSSPDLALTAFCQLGALRCSTRRAMRRCRLQAIAIGHPNMVECKLNYFLAVFFFDKTYAYVLAEATRSLSLLDESIQDIEDEVWLGHSKIPRGYSVCEQTTVHLQPADNDHELKGSGTDFVHIVNDLREDTNFCDRPYVTGGPKARFYAGVPIRTARGINIGAYCLLDDRPRDGLKDSEFRFLRDMASTVMSHLEGIRAKSQAERAARMVTGFGSFVNDVNEGGISPEAQSSSPRSQSPTTSIPDPDSSSLGDHKEPETISNTNGKIIEQDFLVGSLGSRNAPKVTTASSDPATGNSKATDLRAELVSVNVRNTFPRAAGVLREAVQLDGVIFLDASPAAYGSLVEIGRPSPSQMNSDTAPESSTDEGSSSKYQHSEQTSSTSNPFCSVLGASYRSHPRYEKVEVGRQIEERFLKKLLRRYPKGKVWNFSAEGISSSDDDDDSPKKGSTTTKAHAVPRPIGLRPKKSRKQSRLEDGKRLAQQFPGVRSLAINGIWNESSGRWHAASITWTYDHYRSLSEELEMPFLQAFSDVIMVEVHRIEVQKSDRAKVDFISSISHELRSPLHGILGSVECIQEDGGANDLIASLASQIDVCGRTLLDIVNSLLDFGEMTRHTDSSRKRPHISRQSHVSKAGRKPQIESLVSSDTEVALDRETEEAADATYYSFCCSRDQETLANRDVTMIMDIERGSGIHWWCRIALGGWKRIILNLVSNALKYTQKGHIIVSLRRDVGNRNKPSAVLTVTDTGQGMSKAFLQEGLFSAFSQENSFAEGTGLGMSLVATIVKAFGGNIEVQSEEGVGTSVIVRVPLELVEPPTDHGEDMNVSGLQGLTVAVSSVASQFRDGQTPLKTSSHALLIGNIVQSCNDLGVKTIDWNENSQDTDVILVTEEQFDSYVLLPGQSEADVRRNGRAFLPSTMWEKPSIVLLANAMRLRQFRMNHLPWLKGSRVELMAQPVGPNRLATALRACLAKGATLLGTDSVAGAVNDTFGRQETLQSTDLLEGQYAPLDLHKHIDKLSIAQRSTGENDDREHISTQAGSTSTGRESLAENPGSTVQHASAANRASTLPPGPSNEQPSPAARASQTASGMTLLVVDDNAINLQLLTTFGNKHGHQNIRAHNGQHALGAYKAACTGRPLPPEVAAIQTVPSPSVLPLALGRPDVILMDINMPEMSGFEATREIRAFERSLGLAPTTIVALTGLGSREAQQEAYSSGMDLFLTKPVRLKELGKILEGIKGAR